MAGMFGGILDLASGWLRIAHDQAGGAESLNHTDSVTLEPVGIAVGLTDVAILIRSFASYREPLHYCKLAGHG